MSGTFNAKAYEAMDYGMYLVSTSANGKRQGCIATSFAQVTSSRPPRFTVTLNKDHATTDAVLASGVFSVTLLAADCPEEVVNTFGYKSGRVGDKFTGFEAKADEAGCPYLTEHMVSRVSCRVVEKLEIGSYILFVGEATEAEVLAGGRCLRWARSQTGARAHPPLPPWCGRWWAAVSAAPFAVISTRARRCPRIISARSAMRPPANSFPTTERLHR